MQGGCAVPRQFATVELIWREATDLDAAFSFTGRMVDVVCHACAPDAFLDAEEDSGGEGPDADAGFDYAQLAEAMGSDSDEAAAAAGGEDGEDVDEVNSDDDLGAALAGTSSESDDDRGERNDDAGPAGALLFTKVWAGGGVTCTFSILRHHSTKSAGVTFLLVCSACMRHADWRPFGHVHAQCCLGGSPR